MLKRLVHRNTASLAARADSQRAAPYGIFRLSVALNDLASALSARVPIAPMIA